MSPTDAEARRLDGDGFGALEGVVGARPLTRLRHRREALFVDERDARRAEVHADHPGQVLVTGRAGTVVVLNAHAWHAGTANRTGAPRTALHAFYCRRDRPQQQYQKALLGPEVQRALTPELRHLLALDDPL